MKNLTKLNATVKTGVDTGLLSAGPTLVGAGSTVLLSGDNVLLGAGLLVGGLVIGWVYHRLG